MLSNDRHNRDTPDSDLAKSISDHGSESSVEIVLKGTSDNEEEETTHAKTSSLTGAQKLPKIANRCTTDVAYEEFYPFGWINKRLENYEKLIKPFDDISLFCHEHDSTVKLRETMTETLTELSSWKLKALVVQLENRKLRAEYEQLKHNIIQDKSSASAKASGSRLNKAKLSEFEVSNNDSHQEHCSASEPQIEISAVKPRDKGKDVGKPRKRSRKREKKRSSKKSADNPKTEASLQRRKSRRPSVKSSYPRVPVRLPSIQK